jgi:hypothetical protein
LLTIRSSSWPFTRRARAFFLILLVILLVLALSRPESASAVGPAGPRDGGEDPWTLCARHAHEIENREGLPPHLLSAISKVESGRWVASRKAVSAWPWTVTSGGKGRFYATLEEALEAVQALRASGRRNIDVGCMQVNLLHHPNAFEDMRSALDPASNIAYAAGLLQRLMREARSWPKAIAYYHSRTPSRNGPYRRKVFRVWHDEWRRANMVDQAEAAPVDRTPFPALSGFGADDRQARAGLGQIQLGAFRVPENARAVWQRLQRENAALLADLRPRIDVVADMAGELHLLRVSPVMTLEMARALCSQLLDRAVDCLVVAPPQRLALDGDVRRFR